MRLIPVLLPCAGVFDHLHDYIRNRPDKEEYHQPSAQPIVRRLDTGAVRQTCLLETGC